MDKMDNNVLSNSSAVARGQRLKYVRTLANLSREQFCSEGSTINSHTLVGWENARFGGLTNVGAKKIVKRLEEAGVLCSVEWLLEGDGTPPFIDREYLSVLNEGSNPAETEDQIITRELALFKAKNVNPMVFLVNDDCMLPEFSLGDSVAGIKRCGEEIVSVIGLNCIVETTSKSLYLRNVRHGQSEGYYTLVCTNPRSTQKDAILFNVKLDSAAPVIWHRRKNPPIL